MWRAPRRDLSTAKDNRFMRERINVSKGCSHAVAKSKECADCYSDLKMGDEDNQSGEPII